MAKKKQTGKTHPNHLYKTYDKDGDKVKRKNSFCPKCGEGIFLANHKDRKTCGKCSYTEFVKK